MKKIVALLLAAMMLFVLVACDTTTDESSSPAGTSNTSSTASADDESSEPEESSVPDESDTSDDTSQPEKDPLPEYLSNFVSFANALSVGLRATDSTSVRLTKINEAPVEGDIVLFTKAYGDTIEADGETYEDFEIVVFEYQHDKFTYVRTADIAVGEDDSKATTAIPEDGFVLAVSALQEQAIANLKNYSADSVVHVHGVQIADVGFTVQKIDTAPKIDGVVTEEEWGSPVFTVDEKNELWAYSKFKVNEYYATADIYARCDDENLYFAVVVESPYHYCPLTSAQASSMYNYECIQVNVVDQSPLSDYMLEHYDNVIDSTAVTEGHVRQYGFAVSSDTDETLSTVYMGTPDKFTGKACVTRDDANTLTTYEISIPWEEIGVESTESGTQFGLSFSINSTNEDDIDSGTWKNIILRDGGGIINRNDWSKIPVATIES